MARRVICISMVLLAFGIHSWAGGQSEEAEQTLTWLTWGNPEVHGHREVADLFEEQNPGVRVEIEQVPFDRYEDVVRTRIAGGDPPDVMQVNDSYGLGYYLRGLLEPLDDYMAESSVPIERQELFDDVAVFDGERVGWGMALGIRAMWYNLDMFEEAGLEPIPTEWENPWWNWDRLISKADALTDTENNIWGAGIMGDDGWEQIMTHNMNGEGVFGPASDRENQQFLMGRSPGTDAIQLMADLTLVHGVQPTWDVLDDAGAGELFMAGQLGVIPGMSNQIEEFRRDIGDRFRWAAAPIPVLERGGRNEASSRMFGIPQTSDNKELAFALLAFSVSDEAQAVWTRTGYGMPVERELAERFFEDEGLHPSVREVYMSGYDYTIDVNPTPPTELARQIYRPVRSLIWSGERTAEEAFGALVDEIEEAIAEGWQGVGL